MSTATPPPVTDKVTKKALTADHPTWCPGCGDFAVLAIFYRVLEKLQIPHEKIITIAGIGCSSRFPYFMNTHGVHYIHGRALPFATAVSLARPDCHVFVFGGDGDGFSIGGNHLNHAARKNLRLTYIVMDNFVYGLTKMQTSPTSPIGYKSKTDPTGAIDQPINPMKQVLAAGAGFVGRTHAMQVKHMEEIFERAIRHEGFSIVQALSECVMFYPGAFDDSVPRKGGKFEIIEEKKWDGTPEDEARHDVTNENAAYQLAALQYPGKFGVLYDVDRPTKNVLEQKWIDSTKANMVGVTDRDTLQKRFDMMK